MGRRIEFTNCRDRRANMDDLEARLLGAAQEGVKQYWSNFLITVNTNFVPQNNAERIAVTSWLQETTHELFHEFDTVNGTLLKPAGAPNAEGHLLPEEGVIGVRARVGIEQGPERGAVHAHILVEVCHRLGENNDFGFRGVHINRALLQKFFDQRLRHMDVAEDRKIDRVYLNSKLQTKGTDNSGKYMTIAYLNKDRDVHGRNLRADRQRASARDRQIYDAVNQGEAHDIQP